MAETFKAKIKSKKVIDATIPRESQGWWADVCPGKTLIVRVATQEDVSRCWLREGQSRDPSDYFCEVGKRGALISKVGVERVVAI